MTNAKNWGITPDEGNAIIAHAGGNVLVRDSNHGGRAIHAARLVEVTHKRGRVHASGTNGIWYDLGCFKPANGKPREIVDSMRAKMENEREMKSAKEKTMPPEFAPRPKSTIVSAPAPVAPPTVTANTPGAITIAASKIETALRVVEEKRAQIAAAQSEYEAAKALLDDARAEVEKAEADARRLAVELNKLITVS